MLNAKDLEQFKELLHDIRSRVSGDVKQLSAGALNEGQESKSPTHMAELGTDSYERDFTLSLMQNDQHTLAEIHAALTRIEEGTFGLCEACLADGKSGAKATIPKTRLKAIPFARNCIECETKREQLAYR